MKNIIKRGTSLLLVLAMLLSFAAVVGAEEPTATPGKILTLTVEDAVVKAGVETYIPAYVEVNGDDTILSVNLSATSANSAVQITGVHPAKPLRFDEDDGRWIYDESTRGILDSSAKATAPDTGVVTVPSEKRLVWAKEYKSDGFAASEKKQLLCYIGVLATETTTAQVSLCASSNAVKSMFATWVKNGSALSHSSAEAEFVPGTAVVIPATASLPTVILTQSSFAAPTQAGLAVGGEAAGDYDLTKYVKLVTEEGLVDVTSLSVTVNGDKSVSLKQGNVLSLATTAEKDKGYKLTVTAANGSAFDPAVELPFTVSKQDSAFTMAGFTKNGGYSMDFAGPYEAPAYSGTTANKFVPLDPKAYDQYGMSMGKATTELKLYSDAACTKEITSGNAFESVTVAAETGSVQISKNLQADVWCKVRASATIKGVTKTSDWITFQIKSNYPQAARAKLELRGMDGKPFSEPMTTIAIPWGEIPTNTYTVHVSDFRQADGKTMPEGTEPSATDVIIALDGTYTGVSIENGNKLVISKTAQAGTVTVKATLNGKELGTLALTLQKAASVVTELKLYDRTTGKPKDGTEIEIKSGVTNGKATLPGIRANDELVLEFEPVCAIDQYGDIVQTKHAEDGGYANRDYLSALDYVLYKYDEAAKEYKTFTTNVVRTVDTTTGVLKLTLKNELDKDTNELLIPEGKYCLKTWANSFPDCKTMLSSAEFELVKGASVYDTLEVTVDKESVAVPYLYGTDAQRASQYLTLTVNAKDQYGEAIEADKITDLALDESTVWVGGNAIGGILPVAKDQHTTTASNVLRLEVKPSAGENMKTNLTADLEVTLTFKIDGAAKTIEKTKVTTLTKDASVLSTAAVGVGETAGNWNVVDFYSNVMLAKKEQTVNLIAPKDATKSYKISILNCDQYGAKLDGQQYEVTAPEDGSIAIVDQTYTHDDLTVTTAAANKELVISFPNAANPTWKVTIKVVPMEFVKTVDGKTADDTFKLSDYLTNGSFSAEYNGQLWSAILAKKDGAKVYIKTAEGENNTEIPSDKLTLEVTKDGTPVGMDAKANAGSYQVKLVYTDEKGQKYTVDEKTFTISPKTVTITANGTITKEYDGSQALPAGVTNDSFTKTGTYETVVIDPSALQYASADASDTAIQIVLADNQTTCLTGDAAINYNVSLDGLTGTITPRKLIVTPNKQTFTYGQDTEITNALTTEFDYAGKNGDLPSGLTPTFTGSMKLTDTKNDADVTVYNAGTYNVANKDLSAGTNYEIEFKTTVNQGNVKWIVSPKTVEKFDCEELNESYGINVGELYTSLANMCVVTNANGSLKISDLYDVTKLTITGVASTGTDPVNAGTYTVSGWDAAKKTNANYSVTSPKVTITVNPHALISADIQSTDDWGTKDFTGEEQTFTAFKVSFTYNERTIDLVENQDYVIVDNSNKGTHGNVTLRIKAADGSTNYTGEARAPQSWSIIAFKVRTGDLEIYQTNTLTYDGTPKTAEFAVRVISTDPARQKVLSHFTIANNIVDMWGNTATDAGEHTAGGSFAKGFSKADNGVNVFTWKILKSDKSPIQNQSASTKYGQPGSKEISVSDGVKKGLDTSKLSVSIVRDTDKIISGTPTAKFENGKITVNWQLQGDAATIDKSAKLRVTVAETDNYKPYTFDVDVTVTAKTPQTNFGFTTATDATVGYAEDTYTNPVQNAKTTPEYTSSKPAVATVDSNGVVTILDVGETVITATAPEDANYASATARYTLTVVRSTLTVTASSATMTANDSVPSFTASVTGLKRGQTTAQVFQTLTASAATDGKTAGTYAVNASAALKTDFVPRYTLRFVPGTLTVNPAVSVIDTILPTIIAGNGCANGYANCACESFYDLDASRWYHEAIDWAYSLGLMNGTTKSTFGPNAAATRAQTWTMLARIAGQDTRRSSTWYEVGQKWAMGLGITDGTNPMGSLTREQLAAMLYRYVGSPAVNGTLTFTDSANVSAWARNAMIWAVQNGILDGVGGNRLNPKGTTTRAQAAAIFMRFSKLINK